MMPLEVQGSSFETRPLDALIGLHLVNGEWNYCFLALTLSIVPLLSLCPSCFLLSPAPCLRQSSGSRSLPRRLVCAPISVRERDGSGPGAPSKLDPDRSDTRGIWAKRAKLLGPARRATSDNGGASGTHDRATASGDYRRGVTVWVITAESKLDLTCFPIFFSTSYYFFLRKRKSFIYYSEVGLQSRATKCSTHTGQRLRHTAL